MKRYLIGIVAGVLVPLTVWATCSLKVWGNTDTLKATDLNSNFSCINTQVPAAGSISDSQIATNAAIQLSKLANASAIPRAWAATSGGTCTSGTCSIVGNGITSIVHSGAGVYTINFAVTRADVNYGVVVAVGPGGNISSNKAICLSGGSSGTTSTTVSCADNGIATDEPFTVQLFDDENGTNGF